MATKVYATSQIELLSGKKVSMRPLKISLLRRFMDKFDEMGAAAASNAQSMDVLMDCVAIAMEQYDPELATNRELMEDELDLPNCYKVVEIAAGIKLGDDDENPPLAGPNGPN